MSKVHRRVVKGEHLIIHNLCSHSQAWMPKSQGYLIFPKRSWKTQQEDQNLLK
jgi:hypothetical protein